MDTRCKRLAGLAIGLSILLPRTEGGAFPEQQAAPLVRSTSRLVLLDVVVTKEGAPLRGLKKDDFTVLENGVPQRIASFEAAPDGRGVGAQGSGSRAESRTIILLDQLNMHFLDSDAAQDQLIALMSVELRGLLVAQDYTADRALLKDKLRHLTPINANSKGGMDIHWAPEYAQAALQQLSQIARASVGAPYSVNVIWVTSGFPGMFAGKNRDAQLDAAMRRITNLLIRCRMRLYTIDPAGVVARIATQNAGVRNQNQQPIGDIFMSETGGEALSADVFLRRMTGLMGGLSYFGRNDVSAALAQAVADGTSAYVISYAPANTDFKGEYRRIEIKTDVEGATARTRPGYYAVADEASADQQLTEARLEAAMASTLRYSGVDLSCPATFDGNKDRLSGKIVTAPRALFGSTETRDQIIRIASFSKDGKQLNFWSWRVAWKDPWTTRSVSASFDKVLSSKAKRVRFLVADPAGDRIGTCDYALP